MTGFSTVSLMREDREVIARFISHYQRLGAAWILIFHDGPLPDLSGLDLSNARIVECDEAFWSTVPGGCPTSVETRQMTVYARAAETCESEWLLVVDADEFVFGDHALGEILDRVPEDVDSLRLPTAEAVWGPGDDLDAAFGSTHFRLAFDRRLAWALTGRLLYSDAARYFQKGLLAHSAGKQVLRMGRLYSRIALHHAERDGRNISRWVHQLDSPLSGIWLGHFDAVGLDRWLGKWCRRIAKETVATDMRPARMAQMEALRQALEADHASARDLFLRLYQLSERQFRILWTLRKAFRREIF